MASNPIVHQSIMAAVLSATSNVLAQLIAAQKEGVSYSLNFGPVLKFVLFTALSTPPNVLWQEYLEEKFPGQKKPHPSTSGTANDEKPTKDVAKDKVQEKKESLNWRNVVMKLVLDQTIGALVNTVLFIVAMQALNGAGSAEINAAIKRGLWPLYFSGLTLWPLVALISFTVLPVENRVLFGSSVGVAWGVYLSLQAPK